MKLLYVVTKTLFMRLTRLSCCLAVFVLGVAAASFPVMAQRPLGIDVSSYQAQPNWTSVKGTGITYAWAKATEGSDIIDGDFTYNESNGKAAGVYMGGYHFAHPANNSPDTEASYFWSEAGSYILADGKTIMPSLDYETFTGVVSGYTYSTWANEWCSDIVTDSAARGVKVVPVIYSDLSGFCNLNSTVAQWIPWPARPNGESPQTGNPWDVDGSCDVWGTGVWTVWQYSQATISGITTGVVDEDVFNGTASQLVTTLIATASAPSVPANTTAYWDPSGLKASPGSGGTGTWNTAVADWWYSGGSSSSNYLYSTSGDNPVFAGTAGTVTLGSSMTAGNLTFSTAGYTLTGTSQTLTLTGSPASIVVPPPGTSPVNISCILSSPGLTISGGGVVVFNNTANSINSTLNISTNTTLVIAKSTTLGFTAGTVTLTNGASLQNNDTTSGDAFLPSGVGLVLGTGGGYLNDNINASLSYGGVISGTGSLTKIGGGGGTGGTLILNGTNTYSGNTIISQGVLALGATGSINSSHNITINASGSLDVSAIAGWTLSSLDVLVGAGSGTTIGSTAAAINGSGTNSPNLGSSPITLIYTPTSTAGDATHPALYISAGTLVLGSGNSFTISNRSGSALGAGQYNLVQQATGNISGTPNATFFVRGSGVAGGTKSSLVVSNNKVFLNVAYVTTNTLNALSPSTYGQTVTFTSTVTPSPTGGTVQFYDNGNPLGSPVAVSSGAASISTNGLSVGSHTITATYGGATLYLASTATGTQQVNVAPLSITANAQSKPYGANLVFGSGSTSFSSAGLENGDTIGTVTLAVSGNGGSATAPVGTYTITPSAAVGGTFNPANYSLSYNPGTLTVTLPANTTAVTITGINILGNGTVQMNFSGTPGYVYYIEGATNLISPIPWVVLSTNPADSNGLFNFTDSDATNFGSRFYQTVAEPSN